jgi:alpha-L-arabinofuranosidase
MRLMNIGIALTALALAGPALADAPVALSLDATKTEARIDRHIFGQFAEDLGTGVYGGIWVGKDSPIPNVRGIRKDVVAALKALHVPVVRWPGGCYADEYHWQDGIGPTAARKALPNHAWGNVLETNAFGTDEFMDFVDQIGSEAYISANVGSGTVKEAADWMAYMTMPADSYWGKLRTANGHAAPYKVSMLGIGNESWDCGGHMSPAEYTSQLKLYGRFVHNYNNDMPTQVIAVGPGGLETDYTEAVMQTYKKNRNWSWDMHGLSLHSYTWMAWPPSWKATGFGEKEYAEFLKDTLKMEQLIETHSAVMNKYDPEKRVSLVVDEWGSWLAPTPGSNPSFLQQQNSMRDAVLAAFNINIFARHADRVRHTNIAQMINVLQAMILTDRDKMVLTPTYHVFKMYVPFQDAAFVPLSYKAGTYKVNGVSLPRIDAIAAKAKDGKIWIAVTNVDPNRPADIDLAIAGMPAGKAVGETLTAPKFDAVNTFDAPDTVVPKPVGAAIAGGKLHMTLAPASVTVVSLVP